MDLNLKDKVFLITGGGSGIGGAIVQQLAAEGAIPVVVDRDEKATALILDPLKAQGKTVHFCCMDLTSPENCQQTVMEILKKFNRIDGLVNNAGVNDGIGLEHGSVEAFQNSIRLNLFHYYYMAHYCLPALKKTRGTILNIASKTGITGQGGTSGYAAAKGGQLALTREWAVELLKYSIRVNAIVPSEVMTPMYKRWINTFDNAEEKLKSIEVNIPYENRMTTAIEIANMAIFLLSDRASHITGQQIFVDGGYVHLDRATSVLNKEH
ncbi:MAG: short-chain dehydrogenase/reductase [Saprospiraceae bacterium]|nr:MAG: short-chain dehydrogenase/reductase [Saprospiraceae bacterium]